MNRWRVGEDRGSKETDGCPLTVARCHTLAGSGQTGVLTRYLGIVSEIKSQLQALQTSGLAVNIVIV
jgi:hypothetical protein